MTKPDDQTTASEITASAPQSPEDGAEKPAADTAGKKPAAAPGTLENRDSGPGDGAEAAARPGVVTPVESTLVGKGGGRPAAKAKDAAAGGGKPGADAAPLPLTQPDKPGKTSADAKPADAVPADPGPKGPLKDAPPDAILRETPASGPAPVQKVTVRKTGFWPVVLGGAVAAGLGAAATIWALPHLPAGWLPPAAEAQAPVDAEAIRADAVSAAQDAARAEVEALRSELASAAPGETPAPAVAPAFDSSALDQQIAALQARIDEQATQIADLAARPAIDPAAAQEVRSLADQATALEQQIQSAAESAQSDITAAQAEAQKLQEAAEASTRRAEAVAAIASLQAALDRGVTPDEARAMLEGAGLDAPEALAREVPSLDSLQAGFGEAARAGLRAALREDSAAGGGNLLTNFLRAQTGARSVTPQEGSDPDAILSRAGAEVDAGRIGAALDEIATLSEAARAAPAMAEWIAGASAYRDAQAALSDLSANSN